MLWCTDKKYVKPIIPASMSRNRFQLLTAFICFDDYFTRAQRRMSDKLAPMREIFDIFVQNCSRAYSPGSHVTFEF